MLHINRLNCSLAVVWCLTTVTCFINSVNGQSAVITVPVMSILCTAVTNGAARFPTQLKVASVAQDPPNDETDPAGTIVAWGADMMCAACKRSKNKKCTIIHCVDTEFPGESNAAQREQADINGGLLSSLKTPTILDKPTSKGGLLSQINIPKGKKSK